MHGQYRFFSPAYPGGEIVILNTITDEGEEAFLKQLFQDVTIGASFYVGLCNQTPVETDTLSSITTEPTVTNGYARELLTRNAVDWPGVDAVNGVKRISSKQLTFAASGGAFSTDFTRAFLCDAASGSTGTLFSYSGPLAAAITLADGEDFDMQYEFFLD